MDCQSKGQNVSNCLHVFGVSGVRCSCGFDSARSQNFIGTQVESAMRENKNIVSYNN